MTYEEKIESLRHLIREAPDVLSPIQIVRWTHQSKNTVYALIKSGRLTACAYHGGFLVAKVSSNIWPIPPTLAAASGSGSGAAMEKGKR